MFEIVIKVPVVHLNIGSQPNEQTFSEQNILAGQSQDMTVNDFKIPPMKICIKGEYMIY